MGLSRVLVSALLVCVLAGGASASPILYLSSTTVPSSFAPTGGDFGLGLLEFHGTRPLIVHLAASQEVIEGANFHLSASLRQDLSADGKVQGIFEGGIIRLTDSSGTELLVGNLQTLVMSEFFDNSGILTGGGAFTVVSGTLAADFTWQGVSEGFVFELMFSVQPVSIGDFSQGFSGVSNVTLVPAVPEPITATLFGLSLIGLIARRRRRA